MSATAHLDPRIGVLSSGTHYAFVCGYDKEPFLGSRCEVEAALGVHTNARAAARSLVAWDVRITFQYPTWDQVDGIVYRSIMASGKSAANAAARRMASDDGHLCGGRGRVSFTATPSKDGFES